MYNSIAMVSEPEPIDKTVFLELGELTVTYSIPKKYRLTPQTLETVRRVSVQPHFVRMAQVLEKEFGEFFEFSVIEVSEGSINIKATLKLAVKVTGHTVIGGVIAGLVVAGATNAATKVDTESQYNDVNKKLILIMKNESKKMDLCLEPISTMSLPLFRPDENQYRNIHFEYCPSEMDTMVDDIKKTVENYHELIHRP
ncbi:TPA: hypothetical protein ACMDXF_004399 [Vibrio parahaemolyticus]